MSKLSLHPSHYRLGNYVNPVVSLSDTPGHPDELVSDSPSGCARILSIDKRFIQVQFDNGKSFREISKPVDLILPVPLTAQWLKDLGYKQFGDGFTTFDGLFSVDKVFGTWNFAIDGDLLSTLQYVHQFQNIHFCLSNEKELQLPQFKSINF